ncbi:hypothetical protein [Trichormus variabilis]|uniref:hypothetical protein n=1 Tax=Anabaena variabilis TaxID=264691 RepID=UPI0018F01133|nr:hypothetical protein [Trichormus variabilis]
MVTKPPTSILNLSITKGNATAVIAVTASVLEEEKAIAPTERRRHRSFSRL